MTLRVAHFIETDVPGGAESLMLNLCSELKDQGIEPVVIHFGHPFFHQECTQRNIEQIVIPDNRYFKKTLLLPLFALQLARLLKRNRIDILHSHLFGPIVGGSIGAWLARVRHIGTVHDTYMISEKPNRIHLFNMSLILKTQLVFISKSMATFYSHFGLKSSERTRVIYNSVPDYQPTERPQRKAKGKTLITTGRLVKLKRINDMIDAASRLARHGYPFKLNIVGDGPERKEIETLIRDLNLENCVHCLGFQSDINGLLGQADIYVQASETEGLSMSILEAMASGLPCVVSDVGANGEMVCAGENGLLFQTGDVEALTAHLIHLLSDDAVCKSMADNSLVKYKEKFSYQSYLNNYARLYKAGI